MLSLWKIVHLFKADIQTPKGYMTAVMFTDGNISGLFLCLGTEWEVEVMDDKIEISNDYIIIKALENGVNIIGLTRGKDTKFHHTEKLDAGEVYIAQFTQTTSAIKIKGKALVYSKHGCVTAGEV